MRFALVLLLSVAVLLISVVDAGNKRYVMPWMCLERCNFTVTDIKAQLETLTEYKAILSGVSFEMFNLGSNSTLVLNNLSRVGPYLTEIGLETFAIISSYPYPPQFLDWMRQLFADPQPFIQACVQAAQQYYITGFEVDWEPTSPNATQQDAQNYAQFLTQFSKALHAVGKKLHVDVGDWSPIWDWVLLGKSGVDRVLTMATYTTNNATWVEKFQKAIVDIPISVLGVGLQTLPMNVTDMQFRIATLLQNDVQCMGIWDTPLPDWWWSYMKTFVYS